MGYQSMEEIYSSRQMLGEIPAAIAGCLATDIMPMPTLQGEESSSVRIAMLIVKKHGMEHVILIIGTAKRQLNSLNLLWGNCKKTTSFFFSRIQNDLVQRKVVSFILLWSLDPFPIMLHASC